MNSLDMLAPVVRPVFSAAPADRTPDTDKASPAPLASARVSISGPGQTLSKTGGASSRFKDIEDSDLPGAVKHLLRMIRELRDMLKQLTLELQKIQADQLMSADAKRIRLLQIQAQISAVNGSLMQATQKLASMIRQSNLDSSQQMMAGHLALQ